MNSKQFFKILLVVCVIITCIAIFNGEWELSIPTLWGIWLYKKDIDEALNNENHLEQSEPEESEDNLSSKQQLIFSLVASYIDEPKLLIENYEHIDYHFEEARDKEHKCQWCEKHEIRYEFFSGEQDEYNDLICSRCFCDYIIGFCEHETEKHYTDGS